MRKEPLLFYILRLFLIFGIFVLLLLTYWSSNLIEQDLKSFHLKIENLEKELNKLKTQRKLSLSKAFLSEKKEEKKRPYIDDAYPNLLEEDPFYKDVLPKMLPKDFFPKGIIYEASLGRPENLHPFTDWANVISWQERCLVSLGKLKFGCYETMAPYAAIKIEERKPGEFWVHLRDDLFWEPIDPKFFSEEVKLADHFLKRHQVTAEDFKLWYDSFMNPYFDKPGALAARSAFEDIVELRVIDPLTFVVKWKTKNIEGKKKVKYEARFKMIGFKPLASFLYKYYPDGKKIIEDDEDPNTYRENSLWAQALSQHWAQNIIPSCGPYLFDGMTENSIRFKRNPNFYEPLAALVEGWEVYLKETVESAWQDFKSGKIDIYEVEPHQIKELDAFLSSSDYQQQKEQGLSIQNVKYIRKAYNYIGWNAVNDLFKDERVRVALTKAIDRKRIIQQYLDGQGVEITGPFAPSSPSYDHSIKPWPFDPQGAKRDLENLGFYDRTGDGVIDNEDHQPFKFKLNYYVKRTISKNICEYISTALKEIGIDCELHGLDIADLSKKLDEKSFDAVLLGWELGTPPEDLAQLWLSKYADQKGSSNLIAFRNDEVDQLIKDLEYEYDKEKRKKLYHRFHQLIHKLAPYTFLYAPKETLLYREYVKNVFIPSERKDLIPNADIDFPQQKVIYLENKPR